MAWLQRVNFWVVTSFILGSQTFRINISPPSSGSITKPNTELAKAWLPSCLYWKSVWPPPRRCRRARHLIWPHYTASQQRRQRSSHSSSCPSNPASSQHPKSVQSSQLTSLTSISIFCFHVCLGLAGSLSVGARIFCHLCRPGRLWDPRSLFPIVQRGILHRG
jgi:hypothetical protein